MSKITYLVNTIFDSRVLEWKGDRSDENEFVNRLTKLQKQYCTSSQNQPGDIPTPHREGSPICVRGCKDGLRCCYILISLVKQGEVRMGNV